MKKIAALALTIAHLSSFATLVEVTPLENGDLFTDQNWGKIEYYAKRLADNKYIWIGNDRKVKLYKSGEYEISGDSVHNISYASRKVITVDVEKDKYLEVELDIACE